MILIKFGGKVLNSPEGFKNALDIITSFHNDKIYIIISAFGTATVQLETIASLAIRKNSNDMEKKLEELLQFHKYLATNILSKPSSDEFLEFLEIKSKEIVRILKGIIITGELTPKTLDKILAYGEAFALKFTALFLQENNLNCKVIDATEFIITNNNHNFAKPIFSLISKKFNQDIAPQIAKHNIFLTQGFVAISKDGNITTMGKESSNLTATLIVKLVNSNNIFFCTDVEGIFSADPKIVPNPISIRSLSYENAYFLAQNGLKLIHPEMIKYLKSNNITANYCSGYNFFNGNKTTISNLQTTKFVSGIIFSEELYFNKQLRGILAKNISHQLNIKEKPPISTLLISDESKFYLSKMKGSYQNFDIFSKICCINIDIATINSVLKKHLSANDFLLISYKVLENSIVKLFVPYFLAPELIKEIHQKAFY